MQKCTVAMKYGVFINASRARSYLVYPEFYRRVEPDLESLCATMFKFNKEYKHNSHRC